MVSVSVNFCPKKGNEYYDQEVVNYGYFVSKIQIHSQPEFLYQRYVDSNPISASILGVKPSSSLGRYTASQLMKKLQPILASIPYE